MVNQNTSWPNFYPNDLDLPPQNSEPAVGKFYRLVDECPPTLNSFRATHEEDNSRPSPEDSIKNKEMCYGTSFFKKLVDIEKKRKIFKSLNNKKIAIGHLMEKHGNMLKTGSGSHYTVWLRIECDVHLNFECLE